MTECCAECRFWGGSFAADRIKDQSPAVAEHYRSDPDTLARKYCRRRAPKWPAGVGFWVPTLPSDWCGEFEAK